MFSKQKLMGVVYALVAVAVVVRVPPVRKVIFGE